MANEVFKKIAEDYGWEPAVTEFMTKQDGLAGERIDDFLKMVSNEDEVKGIMDQIQGLKNKLQQTSRVRQACSQVG